MEVLVEKKVGLLLGGIGKELASGSKTPPKVRMAVGWIRQPRSRPAEGDDPSSTLRHTLMRGVKNSSASARAVAMGITAVEGAASMLI